MADVDLNTGTESGGAIPPPASPPPAEPSPSPAGGVETPPDTSARGAVREALKEHKEATAEGRARGPDGKFIAKASEAAPAPAAPPAAATPDTARVDSPPVAPEQPSTAALKPPTSFSPEAKADWAKASPALQQAMSKREAEVSDGFKQMSGDVKAWKAIDTIIAPHRQTLASLGYQNDGQAISRMLELQGQFSRDPASLIRSLAQSARIDLKQLAAQTPPAGAQPPATPPAAAASLTPAQVQAEIQTALSKRDASDTIAKFEADPKHPHAKDPAVKQRMGFALKMGTATDLETAYEAAVMMDPTLREQVLAERTAAATADQAKKAAAAKAAAVSIRGGPSNGAGHIAPPATAGSGRDSVKAAMAQLAGRV